MSESFDGLTKQIAQQMLQAEYLNSMQPVGFLVQWTEVQDPNSWTLPDLPPEPETEYVEDFCGYKLYRRIWPDGREEWAYNYGEPLYVAPPRARLELRRAILRNRDMSVRRAADGGLVGWRYWTLDRRWTWHDPAGRQGTLISPHLRSPQRGTIWDSPTLTAEVWSDEAACEGVAGIHAALRPITAYALRGATAVAGQGGDVVTGRVRGYGRYVLGTRGWRAERVVIDYLRVPADVYEQVKGPLGERYQCDIRRQWR